jgi:L-ascorbate metabolism protein UlaG (beta-lactamase superfamily)
MRAAHPGSPIAAVSDPEHPVARLVWLGHATVLLDIDGVRVITDPVLGRRVGPLVRIGPAVDNAALGSIDAVLLSHLHADHADVASLRRLDEATLIAPPGAGEWLRGKRLTGVRELSPAGKVRLGRLTVEATPAEHDGKRAPLGPVADPVGFLIHGSTSVYFAGDTDLFAEMSALRGRVDVALLPVSGWGPTLGPGHLDPERAARAAEMIAPAVAIPIHWGTFTLPRPARRPADPAAPAAAFAELCRRFARGVEVRVLAPGEGMSLPPGQPSP